MILMFECGYRYRFFGEDAFISAKVLDISVNDDDEALFATSSVPTFNGANVYVKKLVAAGYKVVARAVAARTVTNHRHLSKLEAGNFFQLILNNPHIKYNDKQTWRS
jgi:DNA mismatch repair ATPase MutS